MTVGAGTLLGSVVALIAGHAGFGGNTLKLLALGLVALTCGAIRRIPDRWLALIVIGLAVFGYWIRYGSHVPASYPLVDWIQPHSIDLQRTLPMLGVLLMLGTVRGALTRGAPFRWVQRGLALLGATAILVYWFSPQHFWLEKLEPAYLGQQSRTPVVADGELTYRSWARVVAPRLPFTFVPEAVRNQWIRADLARGLHEDMAFARQQAGGAEEASVRRQSALRGVLWNVQKGLTAFVHGLHGGSALLAALLVLPLLIGRAPPVVGRISAWLLGAMSWAVPPVNGLILLVLVLGGVPDGGSQRWTHLALGVGFFAVAVAMAQAGRVLAIEEAVSPGTGSRSDSPAPPPP